MRYILAALWLFLTTAWLSGIVVISQAVGGSQWLIHTGQGHLVFKILVMALLCLGSALFALLVPRFPRLFAVIVAGSAGLHLLSGYLVYGLYNPPGWVAMLARYLPHFVPSSSTFVAMPSGNVALFLLPSATLVLLLVTLLQSKHSEAREHGG